MSEDNRVVAGVCMGMFLGAFLGWMFTEIIRGDEDDWRRNQEHRETYIARGCFDVMGELHCPEAK